jgi:hypothetical protein
MKRCSFCILPLLLTSLTFTFGCGSSSSSSDTVFEGTLTQGDEAGERSVASHGANDNIGEVNICALGQCSITDDQGQWGFSIGERFPGGVVTFSFKGHGMSAQTDVQIPEGSRDVYIHFENQNDKVAVHHMTVNEERVEAEGHDDEGGEHAHEESDDHHQ